MKYPSSRGSLGSFSNARRSGFTLIEMIGVLAIIAILAVVIVPKVFDAIRSSKINSTLVSIDTYRTGVVDFVAKYGTIPTTGKKNRIDDLLMEVGLVDERFSSKLGSQSDIYAKAGGSWSRNSSGVWSASGGSNQNSLSRIICSSGNSAAPESANGSNFRLDGSNDLPAGSRIVCAVIEDALEADAREMSERVDGMEMSTDSGADGKGKVVYAAPSNGITDVYIYMIHQ